MNLEKNRGDFVVPYSSVGPDNTGASSHPTHINGP